jgi:SAM-dependent methyltransferase
MAGAKLVPTDADRLISQLRQSIATGASPNGLGVQFVEDSGPEGGSAAPGPDALRDALVALRAETVNLGSLPPCPSTLRGRIGLGLVRIIQRALWWQTQQYKRFAQAVQGATQTQTDALLDFSQRQARSQREVDQLRLRLEKMSHRLAALELSKAELERGKAELERGLEATAAEVQRLTAARDARLDDAFYMELQNTFRGPREQIRQRQEVYLPILRAAGVGTADSPVLDLGCGRGEWLELLRQEGLTGCGVDSSPAMIGICESLGLAVAHSDSASYLAGVADSSLGAITSFHMVEHIPFEQVTALIDEALRTLKPGGLLILETPNPRNTLVGSHTFYLDPTHLKPIPSELLWFALGARGFQNLRLLELHPPPGIPDDAGPPDVIERFRAPLDYAVIGERP